MNSNTIPKLDPIIQTTIKYLSSPNISLSDLALELGISKQAVHKQIIGGTEFLKTFRTNPPNKREEKLKKEIERLKSTIQKLQLQIIIKSAIISFLVRFKEKVLKFHPGFKVTRYSANHKLYIIQTAEKFKRFGGTFKEFCKAIGKSPETISNWQKRYQQKGISGLHDKTTRPKNFGNKISLRIKNFLIGLFLRFPHWSEYQYHMYLRSHPETSYYVSLPTIKKLKGMHAQKSELEKERIIKRWAFNKGTDVWTMDFTCLFKTENYKLQLLTISDCRSRFLFDTAIFLETSVEKVMSHLKELFLKYGKPNVIKADNGQEFRINCDQQLRELSIYLFNSPIYYGQFNGAHERIHKELKNFISSFDDHGNLSKLLIEIKSFEDQYNYEMKKEYLEERTPADVFFNDKDFIPKEAEIVTPYIKDDKIKMNFTNRLGKHGQMSVGLIK